MEYKRQTIGPCAEKRSGSRDYTAGVVTRLINEATPILEGERPKRHLTHLRTIDGQLEDRKTTLAAIDNEILSQIEVGEIGTDVVDSEAIAYKIAQMQGEIQEVLERADAASHDEHVTKVLSTTGSHERTSPPSSPALLERIEGSVRSLLPFQSMFLIPIQNQDLAQIAEVAAAQVFR